MLEIAVVDILRELARHPDGLPADASVKWPGCPWNAVQLTETVKFAVGCGYAEAGDGRLRITKIGVARMNRITTTDRPLPVQPDPNDNPPPIFKGV